MVIIQWLEHSHLLAWGLSYNLPILQLHLGSCPKLIKFSNRVCERVNFTSAFGIAMLWKKIRPDVVEHKQAKSESSAVSPSDWDTLPRVSKFFSWLWHHLFTSTYCCILLQKCTLSPCTQLHRKLLLLFSSSYSEEIENYSMKVFKLLQLKMRLITFFILLFCYLNSVAFVLHVPTSEFSLGLFLPFHFLMSLCHGNSRGKVEKRESCLFGTKQTHDSTTFLFSILQSSSPRFCLYSIQFASTHKSYTCWVSGQLHPEISLTGAPHDLRTLAGLSPLMDKT